MSRENQHVHTGERSGHSRVFPRHVVRSRNRVKLLKEHEKIWKDVARYPTNQEAATAISKMLHSVVQVQTVRRRFGPSGRGKGAPRFGTHAHTTHSRPAKSHPKSHSKSHHDGGASPRA